MKRIEVISLDRVGLVGEISNVIRRLNGNIIAHTANVVKGEKNTLVCILLPISISRPLPETKPYRADSAG